MFVPIGVFSQSSEISKWYTTGKTYQSKEDFLNAVKAYAKAVELCPSTLDVNDEMGSNCINSYFNIGVCAQSLGKYETAEEQYSIVLTHMPSDHEAYVRRGACRTEMNKKTLALSDMEKAMSLVAPQWGQLHPATQYWYAHDLALAYRNANQLDEAITYLDKAIQVKDGAEIRLEKAKILLRMGKYNEVEKELNAIERMKSKSVDYTFIMGEVLMKKGEYAQALNYLGQVSNPEEQLDAQRHRTFCQIQLNYTDAARKQIQYLRENGYNPTEIHWLESLMAAKEGRWSDALDKADWAESIHTSNDTLLHQIRLQRARVHYRQGDFRDALGECSLVLSEYPMHIEASTLKGLSHLELGQRTMAGDIFRSMAEYYPGHPMVESRYGWYLYRLGQKEQAADKLLNLVAQYPDVAEIRYYYAEVCYQLEIYDPQECKANLDIAIGLDPAMGEAYALKARILHENSHLGEAMMFLNRAEELGLVHSYASVNAAKVYLDAGDYEKALEKSKNAMRDADEADFQRMYGRALGYNGQWRKSIQHLDYCIQLNPNDWKALKLRAIALTQVGEHRSAIKDLDRAVALSPNDAELYNLRGKSRSIFGKYDEAIYDFDMAVRIKPGFTDAHYQRGRMYLDQRDYANASVHLGEALRVAANDPDFKGIGMLYNDLGLAKSELDDPYGALGFYDEGIELDPNDLLFENRARLHSDLGKNDLAMQDYQKAINLSGNDPDRYYELGKIQKTSLLFWEASNSFTFAIQIKVTTRQEVPMDYYRKRGECYLALGGEYLTSAEGDFNQLKERDSRNWQPLYYLGRCKYEKGDYARAIRYYTDAIGIDNQHEEVYIARGDAFSMVEAFGKASLDYGAAISLNPGKICYYKKKGHANLRGENWITAIKDYDDAIALASREGMVIEVELYHGKGRAYTGKAYAEESDLAYQLAIDNYKRALELPQISEQERYFVQLNMMTTYEKWGMYDQMNAIKQKLTRQDSYSEPAVMSCG